MRSLNIIALVVVSAVALACGSSTPSPENPSSDPSATAAPADGTASPADAGPPPQ
jgi:hypothetical protein